MCVTKSKGYKYCLNKAIFQYGIPTAVICAIIYYFISRVDMPLWKIANDMYISVFVTGLICSLTMIPGVKGDMKKEKLPDMTGMSRPLYSFIPKNIVLQSVVSSLISMVLYATIPCGLAMLVASFFPNPTELCIPANIYWIVKSVYSGVFIAFHIFHATACAATKLQAEN